MDNVTAEGLGKLYRVRKKARGYRQQAAAPGGSDDRRASRKARVKEVWAVRDATFRAPAGSILGVIGPNGAGKTTLLKLLGRVTPPTEGHATVRGRVVPLLEIGAGFQSDLTGRENVRLNAALYGIPRSEAERRMDEIVAFAELGDFIDGPVRHYSSGMYLRLAFSVAINLRPDVLLADEVLAVGDLSFQERCLARVREVGQGGATILFVSHDMAAITRLCDRVLWLNGGRTVEIGEPREVVARYEAAALGPLAGTPAAEDKSPGAEWAEPLTVRLAGPEGRPLGAARVAEDVRLELRLRVREPGVAVRPLFDVYTRGHLAFRAVAPAETVSDRPGTYAASAVVPRHLLSETVYSVDAGAYLRRGSEDRAVLARNALTFRVYDTDAAASSRGTFEGVLPGAVSPKLDWTIRRDGHEG